MTPCRVDTPRRAVLAAVGIVGLSIVLSACPEPFEPYWSVDKFRVLGVRSDPATLQPGETARLSVLDYVPAGQNVTYEWSWCPVEPSSQERYECPLRGRLGADAGGGTFADAGDAAAPAPGGSDSSLFDLGSGPEAALPYPGTREQVLELCRRIQRAVAGGRGSLEGTLPTSRCERGYDIAIRLEASTNSGTTEIAKKTVTLWTGSDQVNSNPEHGGIAIRVAKSSDVPKARRHLDWVPSRDRPPAEQWFILPANGTTPVLADMAYDVRAEVGIESAETWRPPPPRGAENRRPEPRRERLSFRWFVARGTIGQTQRIFIPGTNEIDELRKTEYAVDRLPASSCDADSSFQKCGAYLWSVVRDGRGGLSWSEARLKAVGSATSSDGG